MLYSLKPKFYHSNIDIPELLGYNNLRKNYVHIFKCTYHVIRITWCFFILLNYQIQRIQPPQVFLACGYDIDPGCVDIAVP